MKNYKNILTLIISGILIVSSFSDLTAQEITLSHKQAEQIIEDLEQGKIDAQKVNYLELSIEKYSELLKNKDLEIVKANKLIGKLNIDIISLNTSLRNDALKYERKLVKYKKTTVYLGSATVVLALILIIL